METNFETIKTEILRRAKEANACKEQYGRAYKSETLATLMQVVKDNFDWCFRYKVLTTDLIGQYRDDFAAHDIYCNVSVERGYLLCDSATVTAWGSATVEAWGNATVTAYDSTTVEACDSATVKAYGSATVEAWDSATVKACDSATVTACGSATVKAYDNATVTACDSATVKAYGSATVKAWGNATVTAYGSATVTACDSATVTAYGNAYCTSYSVIECKLSENAIYRVRSTNTVYFASDQIKFVKQ